MTKEEFINELKTLKGQFELVCDGIIRHKVTHLCPISAVAHKKCLLSKDKSFVSDGIALELALPLIGTIANAADVGYWDIEPFKSTRKQLEEVCL